MKLTNNVQFESDQLRINELTKSSTKDQLLKLAGGTIEILTPEVLKDLPKHWQKDYDTQTATTWLETQILESKLLQIREKNNPKLIGFLILFEQEEQIYLGYLFNSNYWGKGYGKELVLALIDFLKASQWRGALTGGVSKKNIASIKILEKCGFSQVLTPEDQELKFSFNII